MDTNTPDHAVDYVEFVAFDLDRTRQFYENAFGWTFQAWGDGYLSFSDGRLSGGFARTEVEARETSPFAPLVVLFSRDLEDSRQRVRDNGGRIVRDIFPFPGGRRFHFQDPEGNVLAVWSDREPLDRV
ncbi:MAG: VOC family protein [Candidatus Eisenbacteria bacterium]